METKQSRNSRLASLPGLFCLLVLALASNYYSLWAVSAFLVVIFLLGTSSYVWSRGICRRVEVDVDMKESMCHAGGVVTARIRVKNKSLFPMVWMDVLLPQGERELVRVLEEQETGLFLLRSSYQPQYVIRQRFVWLLWQQEVTWEQEFYTRRRGVWELTGAGLQAGDGFGLSAKEDWRPFSVPIRLYICPKRMAVDVSPFLKSAQEATAGNRGQMEDITILKSSRPYMAGDPMKRINWRLLARSGQMMVNQYEKVLPGCTAFVLDLETFRRQVRKQDNYGNVHEETVFDEAGFETMLSRVASVMWELSGRGILTALVIPGYREREAVFVVPGEGVREGALTESMKELAALTYGGEDMRFPYEEFWNMSHLAGSFCICTREAGTTTLAELAEALGRGRVRFMAAEMTGKGGGEYEWIS